MKRRADKPAPKPPRSCVVCGRLWTQPEFAWDAHLQPDGEMVDTCSHGCRAKAGLKERKQ